MKKRLPERFFDFWLWVSLIIFFCASAQAKRSPFEDIEEDNFVPPPYIETAQQSLTAGDVETAVRILKAAQACWAERFEKCGFTQVDFNSLAGVVYLEQGLAQKSATVLESVVASNPSRTMAWFYLGQAYFRLEKFRKAARALVKAESVGRTLPQYHTLLVRSWMGAKRPEKARKALDVGLAAFPDDPALLLEVVNLFIAQGLYKTATDFAARYAETEASEPALAFLITAESYRAEGRIRGAIHVLEQAVLTCGDRTEASERLAYAYAEANLPLAAARLFEKLTDTNPDFAFAASEQYRLADHYTEALWLAGRIVETARRKKQLAAIYIQMESFDTAVEVLLPLFKTGHLGDRYALHLAYAALRAGRYELADQALKTVRAPALEEPVAQLERALSRCLESAWRCQ
jgi:tetratricopeptide (TPR) repeat protein